MEAGKMSTGVDEIDAAQVDLDGSSGAVFYYPLQQAAMSAQVAETSGAPPAMQSGDNGIESGVRSYRLRLQAAQAASPTLVYRPSCALLALP